MTGVAMISLGPLGSRYFSGLPLRSRRSGGLPSIRQSSLSVPTSFRSRDLGSGSKPYQKPSPPPKTIVGLPATLPNAGLDQLL